VDVGLSLLPVALGFVITLALMRLLAIDLNFMNIIVLPMVFGLGVDDGIHFVHRLREDGARNPAVALTGAGRPIIVTSLTTMVGFGSLVLADNPGLRSIGHLALIGVGACLVCSVVTLPAVLLAFRKRTPG